MQQAFIKNRVEPADKYADQFRLIMYNRQGYPREKQLDHLAILLFFRFFLDFLLVADLQGFCKSVCFYFDVYCLGSLVGLLEVELLGVADFVECDEQVGQLVFLRGCEAGVLRLVVSLRLGLTWKHS